MEPIINPWVIYILPLVNVFIHVMAAIALLTFALLLVIYILTMLLELIEELK